MQVLQSYRLALASGCVHGRQKHEKSLAEATGRLGLLQHLTAVPLCVTPTSRGPASPLSQDPTRPSRLRSPPPARARPRRSPGPARSAARRPRPGPARPAPLPRGCRGARSGGDSALAAFYKRVRAAGYIKRRRGVPTVSRKPRRSRAKAAVMEPCSAGGATPGAVPSPAA